jgi:hypothetical protein
MALDIETAIYAAVAGITADATFTAITPPVPVIADTEIAAGVKRAEWRGVQDFPQLRIEMGGGSRMQNAPRVFGQNAAGFTSATCDFPMPETVEVNLIVVHAVPSTLAKQQAIESVIDGYLHRKWPKFGLSWLAGFAVRKQRRRENNATTKNVERSVSRWTLTFNARPKLSQLAS